MKLSLSHSKPDEITHELILPLMPQLIQNICLIIAAIIIAVVLEVLINAFFIPSIVYTLPILFALTRYSVVIDDLGAIEGVKKGFSIFEAAQQFKIGRKIKADNALNQKRRNIFGAKTNCETASFVKNKL